MFQVWFMCKGDCQYWLLSFLLILQVIINGTTEAIVSGQKVVPKLEDTFRDFLNQANASGNLQIKYVLLRYYIVKLNSVYSKSPTASHAAYI